MKWDTSTKESTLYKYVEMNQGIVMKALSVKTETDRQGKRQRQKLWNLLPCWNLFMTTYTEIQRETDRQRKRQRQKLWNLLPCRNLFLTTYTEKDSTHSCSVKPPCSNSSVTRITHEQTPCIQTSCMNLFLTALDETETEGERERSLLKPSCLNLSMPTAHEEREKIAY